MGSMVGILKSLFPPVESLHRMIGGMLTSSGRRFALRGSRSNWIVRLRAAAPLSTCLEPWSLAPLVPRPAAALSRACHGGWLPTQAASRALSSSAAGDLSQPAVTIQRVHAVMLEAQEGCCDAFEPSITDGKLLLDLGEKGQYGLEEASGGRLLLFSPISGPKYYVWDQSNRWWSSPDDGHLMDELLVRELMHITSVYLNL